MIAIYDQEGDIVFIEQGRIKVEVDSVEVHGVLTTALGYYNNPDQAFYVRDQIASAIERGDRLYRMPSVEEVEKRLKKACDDCKNKDLIAIHAGLLVKDDMKWCDLCEGRNKWQPKEQE